MSAPRSAPRLFAATFGLYRRYPALFLFLAAAVIVPYELIALAATGSGPFSSADASAGGQLFLILASWVLVQAAAGVTRSRACRPMSARTGGISGAGGASLRR